MRARGWSVSWTLGWTLAAAVAGWLGPPVQAATRQVDIALVLAVDVSGSVNAERYDLQRNGYAAAFASREVMEAITTGENKAIAVTLVEWSGSTHQRQMVGWTVVSDASTAQAFGSAIAEAPRAFSDWTSISGAVDYAVALFDGAEIRPTRRVIDVSGDGINNNGRPITQARDAALAAGITINGLPILSEYPTLDAYYHDNVIGGPGAFMVVVDDFSSFGSAILNKLVREIVEDPRPGPRIAADR
jgi:hypothetical protein